MNRFRIGRLALLAWACLAELALMASAQAKLIGDFARFEQLPNNPEVNPPAVAWVTRHIDGDRTRLNYPRDLENSFLGVNCYVGSMTAAMRRIVTPNNPSRSAHQQSKFFGSTPTATERLGAGNRQTETEPTATRTYALRRLTFSPA